MTVMMIMTKQSGIKDKDSKYVIIANSSESVLEILGSEKGGQIIRIDPTERPSYLPKRDPYSMEGVRAVY
jgi:hypothetical protein